MSDLDDEFSANIDAVNEGKANFSEDEQNIIDNWVTKLSEPKETDDEKNRRNEYARTLARLVNEEKQLMSPFNEMPPEGDLPPLSEQGAEEEKKPKYSFQIKRMPCPWPRKSQAGQAGQAGQEGQSGQPGQAGGAIPKTRKAPKAPEPPEFVLNEYEDPEEMAKIVARSKGQSFAEFVAAISRYTLDFGQGLRQAMKSETTYFRDYVDNVLSQRIKDLTEVLDEEQTRELLRIKRDIEKWQMELALVKRRIREMVPDFDLDAYKRDRNYLKKAFALDESVSIPQDDSFKRWREETCHRLKWISEMTCRVTRCTEQAQQEIAEMKEEIADLETCEAMKQQTHVKFLNCEIAEYQRLKTERDKLHREYTEMLSQLQQFGN